MKRSVRIISFIILSLTLITLLASVGGAAETTDDKIVIVLDPGHGGGDPGTIVGTRYEAEYNFDICAYLTEELKKTGKFDVRVTHGYSEKKNYLARSLAADACNADLLISLHFNSTPDLNNVDNGVEVLASVLDEYSPDTLARSICSSISSATGLRNGGVKKKYDTGDELGVYYWNEELKWDIPGVRVARVSDYYSMISWGCKLGYPAIIVEHAYLSNPSDRAYCDSTENLKTIARAEAEAIIEYYTGHTHTYGAVSEDRPASCCLEGILSAKCRICGHRTSVSRIPVNYNAHAWIEESKSATCTETGYSNSICQIARNLNEKGYACSLHEDKIYYPASGHSYNLIEEKAAGHGVDGYTFEVCSLCGDEQRTEILGEAHTYESVDYKYESCTESGYNRYSCSVCGDTHDEEIPAAGHSFVLTEGTETPECSSDGNVKYVCSVCGTEERRKLDIPEHTWRLVSEDVPSCGAEGRVIYKCEVCQTAKEEILPMAEHDFGEGDLTKKAGIFSDGEIRYVCANDPSHIKTESVPHTGIGIKRGVLSAVVLVVLCASFASVVVVLRKRRKKNFMKISAEADKKSADESCGKAEDKASLCNSTES